jgi:hypothetical protein
MKNPCYDCQDREVGCHARCEKYIAWADERNRQNEEKMKEKERKTKTWPKRAEKYFRNRTR